MEFVQHPTKKFLPQFERYEPKILDSSVIMTYKNCARRYFFEYVLAFRSKETEVYFSFGSAFHKFMEVIDQTGDLKEAMAAAHTLWKNEQPRDPAPDHKFGFQTTDRLWKSCAVAFDFWEKEKASGRVTVLATEQAFAVEIAPGEYTGGRLDRLISRDGRRYIVDYKTTSKKPEWFARALSPNDQFTRYYIAANLLNAEEGNPRPIQGIVVRVLYNDKNNGPILRDFPVEFTDFELRTWLDSELTWRKRINESRATDVWPMNERSCSFCTYHSVCKIATEGGMANKLRTEFKQRPWDYTNAEE